MDYLVEIYKILSRIVIASCNYPLALQIVIYVFDNAQFPCALLRFFPFYDKTHLLADKYVGYWLDDLVFTALNIGIVPLAATL